MFNQNMKILASYSYPHVISNPYDVLLSVKHIEGILKKVSCIRNFFNILFYVTQKNENLFG